MPTRPRVVVVDDDDAVREIVVQLAKDTVPQAQISAIANAQEALASIKANGADLVITNSQMPDMDGPTLVRELRAHEPETPVIMVSGDPEAKKRGEAAGITRFVSKTSVTARLPDAILSLLKAA